MKDKNLTANELIEKLEALLDKIYYEDVKTIARENDEVQHHIEHSKRWGHYWGGADVIIYTRLLKQHKEWIGDQPMVISPQTTEPKRRVVISKHAIELSWLFIQLRELYRGRIDYISKYDFYGELAQTAINIIEISEGNYELSYLLHEVLRTSKKYL